jgi:ABC-type uncharacterized transport system involved in gliding motility auxiliary subunit
MHFKFSTPRNYVSANPEPYFPDSETCANGPKISGPSTAIFYTSAKKQGKEKKESKNSNLLQ